MSIASLDYTFYWGGDLPFYQLYSWCLAHVWLKLARNKNYELINCSKYPFGEEMTRCATRNIYTW